jgi:hypothetical protein
MATNGSIRIQRLLYGACVALGLYYTILLLDPGMAAASWAVGLIFDPFDQTVAWRHRPRWQRLWLLAHVAIVVVLFGVSLLM